MKNGRIVKAYNVLERLADQSMPIKMAYALFKLRQSLKPVYVFFSERETALFNELKPTVSEDGKLYFNSIRDRELWDAKHLELSDAESDVEFEPVSIPLTDSMALTPNDVEKLDGFVIFYEPEME